MAANNDPIFSAVPAVSLSTITPSINANAKDDGTGTIGTDMVLAFSAGSNGSFVQKLRVKVASSVAATSMSATVIRFFLSSVNSGATTETNTKLFGELAIPAIQAAATTSATQEFDLPVGFAIPSGMYILAATHVVAATNTRFHITAIGGNY